MDLAQVEELTDNENDAKSEEGREGVDNFDSCLAGFDEFVDDRFVGVLERFEVAGGRTGVFFR